jgi:aspartyl-tRNA(Asn)/glutamyl-tRNA(Gln) amidotransferase subunit A
MRVVWRELARATAAYQQVLRSNDIYVSPIAGLPVTIKDNFDISGEPTLAGSVACMDDAPKSKDAPAVSRLRRAGAVPIGRANMSEFAFSGIGLNRNFGTPLNPWQRHERRIAGGSSSGSAVSVADGMAVASLATDTGGSVRVPAALCGLVGFKASRAWSPLEGVFPRSYSLDALGIIAKSVRLAADFSAAVAGVGDLDFEPARLSRLRLGVPNGYLTSDLSPEVSRDFDRAVSRLSSLGASFENLAPDLFEALRPLQTPGFTPPESAEIHRERLSTFADRYDPVFRARIEKGVPTTAPDYVALMRARGPAVRAVRRQLAGLDAIVLPTTPVVAPLLNQVQLPAEFERWSAKILRNCGIANFLDCPAISLPMHERDSAPTGLMLIGTSTDRALLSIASAIEANLGG